MVDDFRDGGYITLRLGSSNVPIWMKFNPASASTKNDGSIPFGSTLISATATVTNYETGVASSSMIDTVTTSSNMVVAYVDYSTGLLPGLYYLTATVIFSISGSALELSRPFDLERIYLEKG